MLLIRSPDASVRWLPAAAAALLWGLTAGSAVLWWLHWPRVDEGMAMPVSMAPAPPAGQGATGVLRALGHSAAPAADPDAQRRFQLLGVIAADSGHGSALLTVDGQPAQAFVQGQTVGEHWRLQSVSAEGVRLSGGQAGSVLELALPRKP